MPYLCLKKVNQVVMRQNTVILMIALMFTGGCGQMSHGKTKEIIVFHAGSLSVPFNSLKNEYEKINPDVKILLEASGSLVCARKITELRKPCDIIASADYYVINELLIPDYTKWTVRFATNEIVIAYGNKSKYAREINKDNWTDILLRDDVIYARSDPNADPCGYRTVFTIMLTEKLYGKKGLTARLLAKNKDFIRPKEVDLVALIESDACDYMFQYKSVAIQHGFKYVELPDNVNLSDPAMADIYKTVSLEVAGKQPGTKIIVTGDYINYSISVLDNAPEKDAALDFLCFILSSKGLDILNKNGQKPVIPVTTEQPDQLPARLMKCILPEKPN